MEFDLLLLLLWKLFSKKKDRIKFYWPWKLEKFLARIQFFYY